MSDVKFCKDCKWCHTPRLLFIIPITEFSICRRPSWTPSDMVTGVQKKTFCENQREFTFHGLCGPDAKYFEPKP